jgi:hypothetical protein
MNHLREYLGIKSPSSVSMFKASWVLRGLNIGRQAALLKSIHEDPQSFFVRVASDYQCLFMLPSEMWDMTFYGGEEFVFTRRDK